MSTRTLFQFDTRLSADTVEWCPNVHYGNILACGTYQLDTETGRRHGSLSLHKITRTQSTHSTEGHYSTTKLQDEVLDYGVLDMKWGDQPIGTLLALAASCGDVVFIRLEDARKAVISAVVTVPSDEEDGFCVLEEVGRAVITSTSEKSGLCLSIDWSRDSQHRLIATSDSLGQVGIVSCEDGGGGFRLQQIWQANLFEAWIVCFGRRANVVYSGGDDTKLCVWDTRAPPERPMMTCREHTMGVCSLQLHPFQEHLLASGSYDERVLVWDVRSMKRSVKEKTVGGGVWRIKWHPTNHDLMVAACMHNGFKILNWHLDNDATAAEIVCDYRLHACDSLAYGVDWSPAPTDTSTHLLASCSFYDHSLHLWTTTLNN